MAGGWIVPQIFRPPVRGRRTDKVVVEQFHGWGHENTSIIRSELCIMMVTHSLLRVKGEPMFADRIRVLRGERNLTQAEVAKEVGLSPRGYQDLELGRKPKYDTLLSIADFYGVSVDWLMGRTQRREVWTEH